MRIFAIFAVAAVAVVIGYEAGHAYYVRSHANATVVSGTMSPHDIHLNYKGMEKLPVHDVKDAF